MNFVRPFPFAEALARLGRKTVATAKLDTEGWARVPLALRDRAFFSSQIENARFLERAKDLLGDFLGGVKEGVIRPDGTPDTMLKTGSRAAFIQSAREFALAEGMGPLGPKDAGTIKDIRSEKRLGLIFDVQTASAYNYGSWQHGNDPDVLDEFPAQRFIREVEVKRERDLHHFHEGEVHLKSDLGFWTALNQDFGVPWGPWGWGCGHDVEDVDRQTAEAMGLLGPGEQVEAPELGFNSRLKASIRTLSAEIREFLRSAFGDQVNFDDDAVHWRDQAAGSSAT